MIIRTSQFHALGNRMNIAVDSLQLKHILVLTIISVAFSITGRVASQTDSGTGELYERLTSRGIEIAGQLIEIPSPILADGLDSNAQKTALADVTKKHGWDRFTANRNTAPILVELDYIKEGNKRHGHKVSLYFVAYGDRQKLEDQVYVREVVRTRKKEKFEEDPKDLSADEVSGVEIPAKQLEKDKFVYSVMPLLKKVQISGVNHAELVTTDESLTVSYELDPRFAGHEKLAAKWRPIKSDKLGNKLLGKPVSYSGYGGYLKVTRLKELKGAMFVEGHFVFHEPQEWFSGGNSIRSKLPLIMQETVRVFRRNFSKKTDS